MYAEATTAELSDKTSDINTKGKFDGKMVYVTDASPKRRVYTQGTTDVSPWINVHDLTTFTTPV